MQFLMRNLVLQHTDVPSVERQGTFMVDSSLRYLERLSHLNVFIGQLKAKRASLSRNGSHPRSTYWRIAPPLWNCRNIDQLFVHSLELLSGQFIH